MPRTEIGTLIKPNLLTRITSDSCATSEHVAVLYRLRTSLSKIDISGSRARICAHSRLQPPVISGQQQQELQTTNHYRKYFVRLFSSIYDG